MCDSNRLSVDQTRLRGPLAESDDIFTMTGEEFMEMVTKQKLQIATLAEKSLLKHLNFCRLYRFRYAVFRRMVEKHL